jgi:hypothetical protein
LAIGGAVAVGVGVAIALAQGAPPPPPPGSGTLTVNSSPSGVGFVLNSANQTTPFTSTYTAGTIVTVTMPNTVSIGGNDYNFQSWNDGNTTPSRQETIGSGTTIVLTAMYVQAGLIATTTSLTSNLASANVGQVITFSGQVTRNDTGAGLSTVTVTLQSSTDNGATWSTMVTAVTNTSGNYSASGSFSAAGTYLVQTTFAGA